MEKNKTSESDEKFVTAVVHLKCIYWFEMNGHLYIRRWIKFYKIHKAFNEMSFSVNTDDILN